MNGRYEVNQTGPLSLGEAVNGNEDVLGTFGTVHFVDSGGLLGGASSQCGGGSIGSTSSHVGANAASGQIASAFDGNKACITSDTTTIGQHIDRRLAAMQADIKVMEAARSRLSKVGALDLPIQTLRDALY